MNVNYINEVYLFPHMGKAYEQITTFIKSNWDSIKSLAILAYLSTGLLVTIQVGRIIYWEDRQPKEHFTSVRVAEIGEWKQYDFNTETIYKYPYVKITGDSRRFYFYNDLWDETVKQGDLVDMVSRPRYNGGAHGLFIDDSLYERF